jgi:hypothetical protein
MFRDQGRTGSPVYSSYFGGSDQDFIASVAMDSSGRIHLAGWTESTDLPTTSGALQHSFMPGPLHGYAFYARLSANGSSLEYATYLGGPASDAATAVTVDANGNAYVAGNTESKTHFPTFNAAEPQPGGNRTDIVDYVFLAKFGSSGAVYSTYAGGAGPADVNSAAVVGDKLYFAGSESAPTFEGGADSDENTGSAYIAEAVAATGKVGRSIALRGVSYSQSAGTSLAVDANHVAYMAGALDPGAAQAFVLVSAEKGVAFQRRDAQGSTSVNSAGSASAAPHWMKLMRSRSTFTAYESTDGTTWTAIGSDTIPMASGVFVGLAVTSHSTSTSATCTFDHVSIR